MPTLAAADVISDYSFGEGDIVDLTGLLFTVDPAGLPAINELSDFVRVVENGADDLLQVDIDGAGDGDVSGGDGDGVAEWVTVATLNADAGVTILYDDAFLGDTTGTV